MARRNITKDVLIEIAFEIAQTEGFQFLSIHNIQRCASCSSQQVYEIYGNIEDLKQDLIGRIVFCFNEKFNSSHLLNKTESPFFDHAMAFIHTAYVEPKKFKLLYIDNISNLRFVDIFSFQKMMKQAKKSKFISVASYEIFYSQIEKLWIFTYELALLIVTQMMKYDEEKIKNMLNKFIHKLEIDNAILSKTK